LRALNLFVAFASVETLNASDNSDAQRYPEWQLDISGRYRDLQDHIEFRVGKTREFTVQLRDPCEVAPPHNFCERQVIAAVVRKSEIADEFTEILSRRLSQDEVSRIQQATQKIEGWPLHIERCNVLDARQLMRRGRQLKRKHGIKLMVVDYLQLMRGRGRSF